MLRLFAIAAALLFAGVADASPTSIQDRFDATFAAVLEREHIPGGAYAIVSEGRILHAVGHGRRSVDGDAPVGADTVFRIASLSKTFAAQLTAQLVQEGRLHWDDPLDRFVPELQFKRKDTAGRLQLQHLLGQSTGIVSNAYDNLLDADTPLERILPQFRQLEPLCEPGRCYTYQNVLFGMIEPALQHATRQPYAELVQQRLFQPLGMTHSTVGMQPYLAAADRAEPHVRRNGSWVVSDVQAGYYQVAPAAGVNASARDLGRWLLAQLGHYPQVVSPQAVETLTRSRVRTQRDLSRRGWKALLTDAHYGLGWRIYRIGDEEIYLHSGWVKGFVADLSYSRRHQTGLVLLLNAEAGVIGELGAAFWSEVLQAARAQAAAPAVAAAAGERHPDSAVQ